MVTEARRLGQSEKDVYKTEAIGDDGRAIHPMLANTKADGSGVWFAVIVDERGALVAKSGVEAATLSVLEELLEYQKAAVRGLSELVGTELI